MRSTPPLITVVTPSFNQGAFIGATIDSILSQDYPHFELLIFDGGSKDATLTVLQRYEHDPRVRWVSEPDRGQADAINKGLAQARGEIFVWLNSDDLFLPGALRRVAEAWQAGGPAIYYGFARLIDAAGDDLGPCPNQSANLDAATLLKMRALPMQPATFAPTEAVRAAGGLDLDYHFGLDYDLWVRLAATLPIRHVPHELALYRLHEASKTVAQSASFVHEVAHILRAAAMRNQLSVRDADSTTALFAVRVYLQPETTDLRRAWKFLQRAVLVRPTRLLEALIIFAKGLLRKWVGDRLWSYVRALRVRLT